MMKRKLFIVIGTASLCSCNVYEAENPYRVPESKIPLEQVAGIMSELPLSPGNLREVYDAVSSSAGNGYDEEYMMSDLFTSPGCGVGDSKSGKKSPAYDRPIRELFMDYFRGNPGSKSSIVDADAFLKSLTESDIQIYWPWSEDWDGVTYPVITFDPGYGAESNYGYEIIRDETGIHVVDSVYVDENVAATRPVWVINRNDDSAFTPWEMFARDSASGAGQESKAVISAREGIVSLSMKQFRMLRNYDSWFGGASEFFVKCGSVDGFKASTEAEMQDYFPTITDFMIVVKRKQLGQWLPYDCMLVSDFTPQMDKVAFLVTEDDGGKRTSWKCSAVVKANSKSYGFELEIPYNDKDDIVWRGQIASAYFEKDKLVTGRFGDVEIIFALE